MLSWLILVTQARAFKLITITSLITPTIMSNLGEGIVIGS